VPLPMILSDP